MDLKTFIAQTLVQIMGGVAAAQKEASAHGGYIHPKGMYGGADLVQYSEPQHVSDANIGVIEHVSFDIAVTVTDGKEGGGGGEIKVFGIGLAGSGKVDHSSSTVSRVQFKVPVTLPQQAR